MSQLVASHSDSGALPRLVHRHRGVMVIDSPTIAREFGRRHDNVMQTLDVLIADGRINLLDFKEITYCDGRGRNQRAIELQERGALIAMPFIGGRKARAGQVRLVDAFLTMRRQSVERKSADWIDARHETAANCAVMAEMLTMRRKAEGKETKLHHYANEARLINNAFAGKPDPIDRSFLSQSELRILTRLEIRNSALIGMGKTYKERKVALVAYAADLRAAQFARIPAAGNTAEARGARLLPGELKAVVAGCA